MRCKSKQKCGCFTVLRDVLFTVFLANVLHDTPSTTHPKSSSTPVATSNPLTPCVALGFPQVQAAFTAVHTQRFCSNAHFGRSRVESQRGGDATTLLTSSIKPQNYQRKKHVKERTGEKKTKKSIISSDASAVSSSRPLLPILNSVRNGTVAKIIQNINEVDGTSVVDLVYVTFDFAPEILVQLTLPPNVQQRITKHATHSPISRLNVGQQVQVRITDVDTMTEKIISCALVDAPPLSRRRQSKKGITQRDASSYQRKSLEEMASYLGKMVSGRVVSTTPYGAFLDIGCKNRNAILHKSRITRTTRVDNVTDLINVGQTLIVRLIEVDIEKGNMAVSLLNEKSEQYMKWRKQHYEIRQFRQAARMAAARAAAAMFEEANEDTEDIATSLLRQMNEEDRSLEKEEVLHGQWVPTGH